MTAPIARREGRAFGRTTHWYVRTDTGEKVPGVTTIIGQGLAKPFLVPWGINTTAEAAVNEWDDLAAMPPADRLKRLKKAAYDERDAAAKRGTEIHDLAERIGRGEEVDVPDELAGHVESAVKFYDEWQPEVVLAERVCFHLQYGWAGTFDLIARFPDGRVALLDWKTSKRIYEDTALQLAAYRWSTHYVDDDGEAQPMPAVDWCGVVHIRADGYDVVEMRADEHVLRHMRYVAAIARVRDEMPDWVSDHLPAPQPVLDLEVTA